MFFYLAILFFLMGSFFAGILGNGFNGFMLISILFMLASIGVLLMHIADVLDGGKTVSSEKQAFPESKDKPE